ncbi:serine hydrolase, partial [Streptomyces sp. NPDC127044]
TVSGRLVHTFGVNREGIVDPDLEPAVLAAVLCPRTQYNGRVSSKDPSSRHPFE